jgi:hypothetical protein
VTPQLEHAMRVLAEHLLSVPRVVVSDPVATQVMLGISDAATRAADQLQREREEREAKLGESRGYFRDNRKGKA